MKSNAATVGFLLLFAFIFAFCFNSCSPAGPDCFGYADGAFRADISGEIDGEKFETTLHFDPSAADDAPITTVRFHSPSYMSGICISTLSDKSSSARLGDMTVDGVDFERFTAPIDAVCSRHNVTRIQKGEDGKISALVEDGDLSLEFVFEDNGEPMPKFINGSVGEHEVSVTVEKFEKK